MDNAAHKRPGRTYSPMVWVVDHDLATSAECLTKRHLDRTIRNLCAMLLGARMHVLTGVHSKRMFDYWVAPSRYAEFMEKVAPGLSAVKFKARVAFNNRVLKWTRKCRENYVYFRDYLMVCIEEWNIRGYGAHELEDLADTLASAAVPERLPSSNRPVVLEWKTIPPKFRQKDIVMAYRRYYCARVADPEAEYASNPRGIPAFFRESLV